MSWPVGGLNGPASQRSQKGTIAAGKRADLLLVDGNPLENLEHASKPAGVMVSGRWLPAADIQKRLDEIAARSANP